MSKRFNKRSPTSLRDALYHVAMLLEENPVFEIPLLPQEENSGNGETMLDALSALHGLPANWVSDAWARWVEIGIEAWEKAVAENLERDILYRPGIRPFRPPGGYSLLENLGHFLEAGYLGKHFWRLEDRYLDLLSSIRRHPMMTRKMRRWWGDRILEHLYRRAKEDPAAFNLFVKKYRLKTTYETYCARRDR